MISEKVHNAIVACLEAGNTPAEIRRKLRVSPWIIRRVRKAAKLPETHRTGPDLLRQDIAIRLRRQGFTLNEIGEQLDPPVTGKRVHQILKGKGIELRCAKCGKPSMRLFYFPVECTPKGAEGFCPGCASEVGAKGNGQ